MGFFQDLGKAFSKLLRGATGQDTDLKGVLSIAASTFPASKLKPIKSDLALVQMAVDFAAMANPKFRTAKLIVDGAIDALGK
jgi:hypothetical protein